ncbi:hypothetical protein FQN57_003650 [Myotisia sp. PD_48]|nr:hypothetical protein FQN57_003650 [Myotisia sp. PD_48]
MATPAGPQSDSLHITPSFLISPAHLAELQPHIFALAHLQPSGNQAPIRVNGRSEAQFRPASVNSGSLTHVNGSAVVRIGDTSAVCGIHAEILPTQSIAGWKVSSSFSQSDAQRSAKRRNTADAQDDDEDAEDDDDQIRSLGLLVPNVSLSTGCTPSIAASAPPTALAQSLSHQILSLLHSSRLVREDDLRIWYTAPDESDEHSDIEMGDDEEGDTSTSDGPEIKAYWVLYIDVLILSLSGNPFDAAWATVVAALRNTKLPGASWDLDSESVLCSDSVAEAHPLNLRGMPMASSFCVFEAHGVGDWRRVFRPFEQQKGKGRRLVANGQVTEDTLSYEEIDKWILADPDAFEESLCPERICVVVDKAHPQAKINILRLEKNGGFFVGKEEMKDIVNLAAARWEEWRLLL